MRSSGPRRRRAPLRMRPLANSTDGSSDCAVGCVVQAVSQAGEVASAAAYPIEDAFFIIPTP